jgi:spore coat polysaccharide biosynthesis protein SpsF
VKTVAIIQARMTSTRLPGKVMMPLAGEALLARIVQRARAISGIEMVAVALPEGSAHDPIAALCMALNVPAVRGPENDVLKRYRIAADALGAEIVVRLTSDCPFLDPQASGAIVAAMLSARLPYGSNHMESGYPLGFDTQVTTIAALREADEEARDPYEREHVTPFLWRHPERYPALYVDRRPSLRHWRLVVDTPEDYALATSVYDALYSADPLFGLGHIERLFAEQPELLTLNAHVTQKPYEGFAVA